MENLKVSIIIPTFNRDYCILETIKNLLDQTYKNIEIIIVDDGSSDNTNNIINEFIKQKNIHNIKYFFKKNEGVSIARNFGINKSTGELIAFQDSDDLWQKDKLKKQVYKIINTNSEICYCGTILKKNNCEKKIINKFSEEKIIFDILKSKSDAQTITWLIRKKFIVENNIYFNEKCTYSEDLEFFLKCTYLGKVCCVKEYLSYYINTNKSLSNNTNNQLQEIDMWVRYKQWIENNKKIYDKKNNKIKNLIDAYRLPARVLVILYNLRLTDKDVYKKQLNLRKGLIRKFNPFKGKYKRTLIKYYIIIKIDSIFLKQ